MKKNKLIVTLALSGGLFLLSFLLGYQLVIQEAKNRPDTLDPNETIERDIAIIKEEEKISPNTIIEERVFYKKCGDLIINNKIPDPTIINMTKEEYSSYLSKATFSLRIVSFSSNKIVIWGEREFLCSKHFIIGEKDGKIAVFKIGEQGEKILYRIFEDYSVELLMELDKEKIKKGMRIDSEEELSDVLENFIS